jgi:hypothetical protein
MIPVLIVFVIALTPSYDAIMSNTVPRIAFQIVSGCIGVIGVLAGMVLFLGMLGYLFLLDQSSWKVLWLIIFFFTACFGSSIYFFTVYKRQVLPRLGVGAGQI